MGIISSSFVRNCWYVAGFSHDFPADRIESRKIAGDPVVLYRRSDGHLAALADRCAHRHAPLSLGRVEGDDLRCMYHGLKFSPDGTCVEIPGQDRIPDRSCVRSYPLVEKGGWVWIWMGQSDACDPGLIPPVCDFDDPEWVQSSGQLDYEAPYELINDNLLDLSHLAFVHADSFGATTGWSDRQPRHTLLDRGIRVERWIEAAPPIPPLPQLSASDTVDIRSCYEFHIPGIFLMRTSFHRTGAAKAANWGDPVDEELFAHYSCQSVTPIDMRRSRTLFSWGPGAAFGDRAMAQQMIAMADHAFREDKVIIEAQFANLDEESGAPMLATQADKPLTIFRGIMQKARNRERDGSVAEAAQAAVPTESPPMARAS